MSLFVWPRLPVGPAKLILERLKSSDPLSLREDAALRHDDAAPIAVGGQPVKEERVRALQERIRGIAEGYGYPHRFTRPVGTPFDQKVTRVLHETMAIVPADAASEEVWNFLSLVVLPDVAVWRWPGRADNRLLGHPRNVFRRLWWRAEVVGSDLIDVPGGLGEDELVNIMERTSLAADVRLARALGRAVHTLADIGGVARSEIMRDAGKRMLRLQSVLCFELMDDEAIASSVGSAVSESIAALADSAPSSHLTGSGRRTA